MKPKAKKYEPKQRELPPRNLTGKTITLPDGRKVRPNQRVPYHKSTADEVARRVAEVQRMLVNRLHRWEIREALVEQCGPIDWRTIYMYINRAKKNLVAESNLTREEARNLGVTTLLEVIRTGSAAVRVSAEARLAEIYGYNLPKQLGVGSPDGTPLPAFTIQVTEAELPQAKNN